MSSDWKTCTLGELGPIKTGKTPPSSLGDGFGGTVPFVTPGDMNGQKWITETDRYLNENGLTAVSSSLMPARSVAVSCIGSDMGKAALLFRPSVTNQQINTIAVDESRFNAEFVYYDLSVRQKELKAAASGSATPILNKGHFSAFELSVPPRATQDKIAEILGRLDDKIAVNRRINQTLEAMAQAIFKSWFVDFDPVKAKIAAKQEGRDPLRAAMSAISGKSQAELDALPVEQYDQLAATAALFPDEMEESKLGMIPRGWEVKKVEYMSEKIAMGPFGSNIKVETFVDAGVPVISGQHLKETLLTEAEYNHITDGHSEKLANSVVSSGDVIFTHAGNIGQVSLIPKNSRYKKYVISQRQFYLRPDIQKITSSYLVYFFRSPLGQHLLLANASQVGVPSISRPSSYLKSIEMLVPPLAVVARFDEIATGYFEQTVLLRQQNENLIAIRDTLLPKLLSGELSVTEAMVEVEA